MTLRRIFLLKIPPFCEPLANTRFCLPTTARPHSLRSICQPSVRHPLCPLPSAARPIVPFCYPLLLCFSSAFPADLLCSSAPAVLLSSSSAALCPFAFSIFLPHPFLSPSGGDSHFRFPGSFHSRHDQFTLAATATVRYTVSVRYPQPLTYGTTQVRWHCSPTPTKHIQTYEEGMYRRMTDTACALTRTSDASLPIRPADRPCHY